jgi:hypothetical protein
MDNIVVTDPMTPLRYPSENKPAPHAITGRTRSQRFLGTSANGAVWTARSRSWSAWYWRDSGSFDSSILFSKSMPTRRSRRSPSQDGSMKCPCKRASYAKPSRVSTSPAGESGHYKCSVADKNAAAEARLFPAPHIGSTRVFGKGWSIRVASLLLRAVDGRNGQKEVVLGQDCLSPPKRPIRCDHQGTLSKRRSSQARLPPHAARPTGAS